jgi:hypothetical protein
MKAGTRHGRLLVGAFITFLLLTTSAVAGARPASASEPAPASTCTSTESGVVPDDCWGRYPSSHYDIGCDEGAWNNVVRKVYCALTDLAFQSGRALTSTALWLVGWSFALDLHSRLGAFATDIAGRLDHDLIGPLGLLHFVWLYAMVWVALQAMRGRLAMAGGELLVSLVVAALSGFVIVNPAGYLAGVFETMHGASSAVLAAGTGQQLDADPSGDVLHPVQVEIHRAFVEDPYDYLDWGHALSGACAAARDQLLANGPHGNDDQPRDAMRSAGCDEEAEFNHDPSGSRMFGAVLTLVAALSVVALLALMAMTLAVAQVLAIVLFSLAPLAFLGGILPGAGREILWRWLTALLRAVLAAVGMSFVLAVLLMAVSAVLSGTEALGLVERFALVNTVVVATFVVRKRILTAGHTATAQLGHRLAGRRAGGAREAAWMAAPALAGATGFALASNIGSDGRSRSSRMAGNVRRNHLANQRMRRHGRRMERRASARVTARERSELRLGLDGSVERRSSLNVDGPVARTAVGRRARQRVEQQVARRHARQETRRRWPSAPTMPEPVEDDFDDVEPPMAVDAEEP